MLKMGEALLITSTSGSMRDNLHQIHGQGTKYIF